MRKLLIPIAILLGLAYAVAPLAFWHQREASAAADRRAELVAQAAAYAGQPNVIASLDYGEGPPLYAQVGSTGQRSRVAALDAQPTTPVVDAPDPEADTLGFLSRVYQLYKGGALVPAIILLAWGAAVFASRKWSKLREGRLAVYFAAGLTALAMLAERASAGDTPTLAMILSAIASAVVLALRPQPSAPKPGLKAVP